LGMQVKVEGDGQQDVWIKVSRPLKAFSLIVDGEVEVGGNDSSFLMNRGSEQLVRIEGLEGRKLEWKQFPRRSIPDDRELQR